MRLKLIACKVLAREIGEISAISKNIIDITWIRQGYHNEPDKLRDILQQAIDRIDENDDPFTYTGDCGDSSVENAKIDYILLGYGLCSNGVVNISSKKYSIVIPRAHDCITLFLGSKERYRKLFDGYNGQAYWYTPGWIENTPMPSRYNRDALLAEYTEKYGEENALYLLETENSWYRDYKFAAYIPAVNPLYPDYRDFTKEAADFFEWQFVEEQGDNSLLQEFLDGNFDEKKFLIVPPNKYAIPSYDEETIMKTSDTKDEFMTK